MKELLVGDRAPSFAFAEFLKGDPVWTLKPGRVHIIEFWAAWCGPCLQSIPILNRLQVEHPEIIVIGVVAMEKDIGKVRALISEKSDAIAYRIALQAPSRERGTGDQGQMTGDWLEASFSLGVPRSFIVESSGRVAWIGPPSDIEKQLDELLSGRLDIEAAAQSYRDKVVETKMRERFRVAHAQAAAIETKSNAEFYRIFDQTIVAYPEIQKEFGPSKLRLLIQEGETAKDKALTYARLLLEEVAHDDAQILLNVGVFLIDTKIDGQEMPQSTSIPDYAILGVEVLERVERLLDNGQSPGFWFQFDATFARGLVAASRYEDALDRTERALRFGVEAGLSKQTLSNVEYLAARCREQAMSR